MRRSLAVAVALSLAVPLLADAQPRGRPPRVGPDQGLYLSGRAGYGVPSGNLSDDFVAGALLDPALDAFVDGKVALWLEVGYRFDPRVRAGFFLELAPTTLVSLSCFRSECDASDIRFGIDVQFHFGPGRTVDPWLGLGVGIEYLSANTGEDVDGNGIADRDAEFTYAGFELPLVEGGLELRVSPRFSLGPYLALSFAQFTSVAIERPGERDRRATIENRAAHAWLQLGLKGTLDL
jgi:hypothetical protein